MTNVVSIGQPTVVLADPYPMVLAGLAATMEPAGFTLLAKCSDSKETIRTVLTHSPDLLVMELALPERGGVYVLEELRRRRSTTRPVLFIDTKDVALISRAIHLGARGLVNKAGATSLVADCLRAVMNGHQWIDSRAGAGILDRLIMRETAERQLSKDLTPRQLAVVKLLAQGVNTHGIAKKLGLAPGTVKIHLHNVYQGLGIHDRVGLVLHAQRIGLT